jgi:hypothetical protein
LESCIIPTTVNVGDVRIGTRPTEKRREKMSKFNDLAVKLEEKQMIGHACLLCTDTKGQPKKIWKMNHWNVYRDHQEGAKRCMGCGREL